MIKIDIPVQKRYRPTMFDQFLQNKMSKGQKKQKNVLEVKIAQKYISNEFQNKENWNKKQEQNLIVLLLKKVIEEPYLQFSWEFYQQYSFLAKISKQLKRTEKSCVAKLNLIQGVHEENYMNSDILEFLTIYWKNKNFKSKEGRQYAKQVKQLRQSQSEHMQLCDKMIHHLSKQEDSLMSLFSMIIKN